MKNLKFIFTCIILFFCTSIFATTQQTASVKLAELLNQFTSFEAQFTQTTTDVQQEALGTSHGVMMMERPNHFRFETKNPTHQIVITNGKNLWVYDVDLKQATEQSIENAPMNPAKLLSGNVDKLLQQFEVHMIPHHSVLVFVLVPKKPNPQFRSVAIAFKHEQLHSMQIENKMEQTTIFTFSNIKLNVHLSPSLFEFKAPNGVGVLR